MTTPSTERSMQLTRRVTCLAIVIAILFFSSPGAGQSFATLNELNGSGFKTYYSDGAAAKAQRMAAQLERVTAFYQQELGFTPSVTLLLLSRKDWNTHTKVSLYGMPHFTDDKLIVASEDNAFWKSMVPPAEQIPEGLRGKFTRAYTNTQDELTMEAFFDLLVIHELGHAYHNQGGLLVQRRWMGELFANILLHSYIAVNEPHLLDALTSFPEVTVATISKASLKFTTLPELEANYDLLGREYPQNYGWYQCRWHMAAGKVYDASKLEGIKNLWRALKEFQQPFDDDAFTSMLRDKVHGSVADVPARWNDE